MSSFNIFKIIVTFLIIGACFYMANRFVSKSKEKSRELSENGTKATATILSMQQSGLFLNQNPVLDLSLRINNPMTGRTYLIEKHKETALLMSLDAYQVGGVYEIRIGNKDDEIQFEMGNDGKPILISIAN